MLSIYGRDLDLNLLRVFAAVVHTGSATQAAAQLYITQPAVSAALRRLNDSVQSPVLVRHGRRLVTTKRGAALYAAIQTHLEPLLLAALELPEFHAATHARTFRVGFSDAAEMWLMPKLVPELRKHAPNMRLISIPMHFRNAKDVLASGIDLALSVVDEVPAGFLRRELSRGDFVCVVDTEAHRAALEKHTALGKHTALESRRAKRGHTPEKNTAPPWTEQDYFARPHVVVSYNGDLRGIVEDSGPQARNVVCAVSHFWGLADLVSGTSLVATVPKIVGEHLVHQHHNLRCIALPFRLPVSPLEMIWPRALDEDPPCAYLRDIILRLAAAHGLR